MWTAMGRGIDVSNTLELYLDYRVGGEVRYILMKEGDSLMRVPDEIRKCAAFICFRKNGGIALAGTGFFVSVPMAEEFGGHFVYLTTAKHVIDAIRTRGLDQIVYVRINLKNKPPEIVKVPIENWISHPTDSSVDVSILSWAPRPDVVDYLTIPIAMAVTDDVVEKEKIGIGDEVFLTGLFVSHYGERRNLPIVRMGNVAMMPEEPIFTEGLGHMDAYLIEARSIGGISGSPVFVSTGGLRGKELRGSRFYWLGLMHGHWDLETEGVDVLTIDALSRQRVNMGIAIVVPAAKILEVLNREELLAERKEEEEEARKERSPTPDSSSQGITKDEFEATLRKVARPVKGEPERPSEEGKTET